MNNNLLKINNLNVNFLSDKKQHEAVIDFSLNIKKNEVFGLVGESGCGKSTLIKSILRILPAPGVITNGQVIFNNQDILNNSQSSLNGLGWNQIALVKQKALNSLNPLLKIKTQIIDTIKADNKVENKNYLEKCNSLMDLIDIDRSYLNSYPHELSGGMRQRIIIAIALALNPKLIIMDEPTTALDVIVEKEIILKILDLKSKLGFSIFFITHDLNLILDFADRIGVMKDGRLVDVDTSNKIKLGGNHTYTQKLINSIPNFSLKSKVLKINKNKMMEVVNLTKEYNINSNSFIQNTVKVLDDISFQINKNEVLSLVGESGSGKSTIAKILTKLISYNSGKVLFKNKDLKLFNNKKDFLKYREKIQMIFQDPFSSLNSLHTVYHHLSRPILIHRSFGNISKDEKNIIVKKEILSILEDVELTPSEEFLYKYPHEMSVGERQRIALARALLVKPELIIADEPTSMLDMSIRMEILQLFKKLQIKKGISILFITHDIASACYLSNRIIILKNGKIVETNTPDYIISQAKNNYSKQLIKSCQPGWFNKSNN